MGLLVAKELAKQIWFSFTIWLRMLNILGLSTTLTKDIASRKKITLEKFIFSCSLKKLRLKRGWINFPPLQLPLEASIVYKFNVFIFLG